MDLTKMDRASREFFMTLADAIEPFRAGNMPKVRSPGTVRINGCWVSLGGGKDKGKIRFGFLAVGGNVVTIDLVSSELMADPKEYIGNMLEALDQGLQQMVRDVRIIVPSRSAIH